MPSSTHPVIGHFATEAQAADAIEALHEAGFTNSQIGVARNAGEYRAPDERAGSSDGSYATAKHTDTGLETGAWDKVKRFFGAEEDGDVVQYADTHVGDRASHEVTRGGYGSGDFSQSLSGLSVPEDKSRYFGHRFENTPQSVVVTVSAEGREDEAQQILSSHGADVGEDTANYDYAQQPEATTNTGTQRIQLLGEVLRVHKDRVNRGEVRIHKEVITEQQTVQVPVTREELVIERVPVNGEVAAKGGIGQSDEIRIPLTEERASVDTQTVVREEVSVGKRVVENVEQVGGSVRHEELEVEDETTNGTNSAR